MSTLLAATLGIDRVIGLPTTLEVAAITFGALSGALHASRNRFDPAGVFTIALLCGVGGGIIRDILLQRGVPVFLVTATFLELACLAAVIGLSFASLMRSALPVMAILDTALIGVWVLIGAEKTLAAGLPASTAILLGVVTATGGGLLRDVLCRTVPPALTQPGEWYGFAAIVAALTFIALLALGVALSVAEIVTIVVAAGSRTVSIVAGWRTPTAYDIWAGIELRAVRASRWSR